MNDLYLSKKGEVLKYAQTLLYNRLPSFNPHPTNLTKGSHFKNTYNIQPTPPQIKCAVNILHLHEYLPK